MGSGVKVTSKKKSFNLNPLRRVYVTSPSGACHNSLDIDGGIYFGYTCQIGRGRERDCVSYMLYIRA